jgi:hypothetical protein
MRWAALGSTACYDAARAALTRSRRRSLSCRVRTGRSGRACEASPLRPRARRVGAQNLGPGLGAAPEARLRRHVRVEGREGDHASDLAGRAAGGHALEVAARVLALLHQHVAAEQDRRDEPPADLRLGVDLLGDELAQHACSLRVPDDHDAAAVVVALQVAAPRVANVSLGRSAHGRRHLGRAPEPRERYLAVHGRVDPAVA